MNKNESKYFCTAAKMDGALLALLEKKDFEYITVKEICEKAGVNRSTFYLHYQNTSELLDEAVRYAVDGFLSYFDHEKSKFPNIESCPIDELMLIRREYVIPYLTYIKENQRVFKTALKHFGAMGFNQYYERMFRYIFNPILDRFNVCANERPYVMKFYLVGTTAVAFEWLNNGCRDSAETVCDIIINCVTRGYDDKTNE